jgi:hypothetical protein
MAIAVQIRRGTSSQNTSFTGVVGELVYTTDTKDLYVHDGSNAGGTIVGGGAASIADGSITYAKIQDIAANNVFLGNDNGVNQDVQELTATEARSILNVADGANNYAHPNHSGDVTSTGDGATVIAANAVTSAKLATTLDFGSIV